ncbi:MAG: GAF domain-containing protein [Anaerolineae bacterium]|nr:GAF domain-containing protein [Anaerolineae bacterium]
MTQPASRRSNRRGRFIPSTTLQDVGAAAFGIMTLVIAVVIGYSFGGGPLPRPGLYVMSPAISVIIYALLYAVLTLFAYRVRRGVYIGFQHTAVVGALLSLGPAEAVLTGFIGAILAEAGRYGFGRWLALRRHSLREAVVAVLCDTGTHGYAVILAGLLYLWLGGAIPLLGPSTFVLPILALLVADLVLYTVALIVCVVWQPVLIKSGELRELLPLLVGGEMLAMPLALLLAIAHYELPPFTFLLLIGGTVIAALLFRLSERSRWALERRVDELATLNRIGQSIASSLSTPELLQSVYTQVMQIIKNDLFYIALHSADTQTLTFPFAVREGRPATIESAAQTYGRVEHIMRNRAPLLVRGPVRAQLAKMGIDPVGPDGACYLGVPLIADDDVIGVLAVLDFKKVDAYSESDVAVLSTIAGQAAMAIHNATLYNRVWEMADEMAMLHNVSSVVTATLDLNVVLEAICAVAIQTGHADKSGVFLTSEDHQVLRLVHSIGLSDDFVALHQNIRRSEPNGPSEVLDQHTTIAISDVRTDPRGRGWRTPAEVEGYIGLLTVPLITNEQVIGFLAAFYQQPHLFGKSELDLMNTLANQAAVTVANVRLFQDVQARAQEMTQLAEASRAFTASLDLPSVAERVLTELDSILTPDVIALAFVTGDGTLLPPIVQHGSGSLKINIASTSIREGIASAKSVILPQTSDDLALLTELGLQTLYLIPLVNQDQVIGAVKVGHTTIRRFSARERQLAEALVNQAAAAIRNAQLFSQVDAALADRVTELSAIEAISRKISGSRDLAAIINDVLDVALEITQADAASCILLTDGPDMRYVSRYAKSTGLGPAAGFWYDEDSITVRTLRTGIPFRVADTRAERHYRPSPDRRAPTMLSTLTVPIIHEQERMGVLGLESTRLNAFMPFHERFISTLADHAAIAIENARLFEEVRAGRDRMQLILDSAQNGMILIENDGKLALANPAAQKLVNMPLQDYAGDNILRIVARTHRQAADPQALQPSITGIRRVLADLRHAPDRHVQYTFHLESGDLLLDVEMTALPVYSNTGDVDGRLIVLRDVSEEKSVERFRWEATNMIVHDLRSPLSTVISSLRLVQDLIDIGEYNDIGQVISGALNSGENQMHMIESILEIAKLETRRMPLTIEDWPINPLLQKAIETVQVQAANINVRVVDCVTPNLPEVRMDAEQIHRVVVNLLDNALRHTPASGQVRLEGRVTANKNEVQIGVIDTGKGIPQADRERIFDKFYQRPNTALRGHKGVGLGLTFCKLTIEAHNGHIWVDDGPEGGAAFWFTLPVASHPKP